MECRGESGEKNKSAQSVKLGLLIFTVGVQLEGTFVPFLRQHITGWSLLLLRFTLLVSEKSILLCFREKLKMQV